MIAVIESNTFRPVNIDTKHDLPFAKKSDHEALYFNSECGSYLINETSLDSIPTVSKIPKDIIASELDGAVILDEKILDRVIEWANTDD